MSEADPDVDRLLYAWVSHIDKVKWVPKSTYSECRKCVQKFELGKQHNCRLCGELFCSACTAKYHLPERLLSGKKGAARVCLRCRDDVLARRAQSTKEKSFQTKVNMVATQVVDTNSGRVLIHPPPWEDDKDGVAECFKCKKKGKAHNCRACGRLFCGDCTRKMIVPAAFERKKKTGPARVCDFCRFLILDGATFDDKPWEETKRSSVSVPSLSLSPSQAQAQAPSTDHHRVKSSGFKSPRPNILGAEYESDDDIPGMSRTSSKMPDLKRDIEVRHETKPIVFAELEQVSPETTLEEMNEQIMMQRPSLKKSSYIFRGVPIPTEFYDVFCAKHLGKVILVREDPNSVSMVKRASNATTVSLPPPPGQLRAADLVTAVKARSLYDYEACNDGTQLSMKQGEVYSILNKDDENWWFGVNVDNAEKKGWLPATYLELMSSAAPSAAAPVSASTPAPVDLTNVQTRESSDSLPPPPPAAPVASAASSDVNDILKQRAKLFAGK